MTNFIRDVREDVAERDRVYLPLETLRRHGVSEDQILNLEFDDDVAAADPRGTRPDRAALRGGRRRDQVPPGGLPARGVARGGAVRGPPSADPRSGVRHGVDDAGTVVRPQDLAARPDPLEVAVEQRPRSGVLRDVRRLRRRPRTPRTRIARTGYRPVRLTRGIVNRSRFVGLALAAFGLVFLSFVVRGTTRLVAPYEGRRSAFGANSLRRRRAVGRAGRARDAGRDWDPPVGVSKVGTPF